MRSVFRGVLSGVALIAAGVGASTFGYAAERATLTARAGATQAVEFDVFLPIEHRAELEQLLDAMHDAKSPQFHKWLKPAEFNARFGTSPEKISAITSELTARGLVVTAVAPRQLHVSGAAKSVEAAFSSELKNGSFPSGKRTVAFSKPYVLPSSLSAADAVVTGLSGQIRMRAHSVRVAEVKDATVPENRYGTTGPYWFTDLKQAYSFPSYEAYTGKGAYIGILMQNDYLPSDLTKYFGHEKLAPPTVREVKIAGGAPFDPDLSAEVSLDLQQSGGMAPGASLVLYNVPDLRDSYILAALTTIDEQDAVDVVNMSFGGPENEYSPEYNDGQSYYGILRAQDDLFAQGNAQGITFVASSGDSGALVPPLACLLTGAKAGCGDEVVGVGFPASSPHVTAVGGTNLVTQFTPSLLLNSAYVSENADDDPLAEDFYGTPATGGVWGSGGGESELFKKPAYQKLVNTGTRFRAVPDVALHMGGCPGIAVQPCAGDRSFDLAYIGGGLYGLVGTSASAPDFAGLLGLKIERDQSRQGNVNYELYVDSVLQSEGLLDGVFRKNIKGYNGYYSTKPGYDKVTGLGSIRGLNFLQAPAGTPAAGVPQTPSNP